MRRALYGGSFDPLHWGHLLLAETARDFLSLDEVLFIPAGIPPHKRYRKRASGQDRFQMIELALAPYPELSVSRFEIDSNEISYSVETIRYYQEHYPNDEFFLLLGSETFSDLPHWFQAEEICLRVDMIIAQRQGFPPPNFQLFENIAPEHKIQRWKNLIVPMPSIGISATNIRQRVALSQSIRFQVPDAIISYIKEHRLYQEVFAENDKYTE